MAKKEKPLLLEKEKPPRVLTAVKGADGLTRCPWPGVDPLYVAYHDEEWGVPEYDDRAMFEKLVLDGFDPRTIVRWSDQKKDTLMQDAGIIRNRAKIEATVALARIVLDFADKGGFARHLWSFVDGRPIDNARHSFKDVPAETDVSRAIAKDLRARGGNFVGPTIIYAFMQATGMVNDHLVDCCRHEACRALARKLDL